MGSIHPTKRLKGTVLAKTTILICIDGFDPEYLDACEIPNLREMGRRGFSTIGQCMMPSVTNVNNVSILTASYPETHGICSNYWYRGEGEEGVYTESADYILAETFLQRAGSLGMDSLLATSKDKLRSLLEPGAETAISSEAPPRWVVDAIGPPPEIYSLEVNGWVIDAANHAMSQRPYDIVYITTTDYAMHTYPPGHPRSQHHASILDDAIGRLADAHPDATILLTADHGMSSKTRMLDVRAILARHGIPAMVVPIIKDRYVVHHSNLGGCAYVYLDATHSGEAIGILSSTDGIREAFPREEAASAFKLRPDRIGDLVVTGTEDVVFGDPAEVDMPASLRSHGSTTEQDVPIFGYNGDFQGFSFRENRDLGRYVFERVLPS